MTLAANAARGRPRAWLAWRPSRLEAALLVYLVVVGGVPLVASLLQLARTGPAGTLRAIAAPEARAAIALSLEVALLAATVNAVLGLAVAWVLGRYEFPGRRILDALVDLPLAIPGVVAGISFMSLYGPAGPVGRVAAAAFGPGGVLAWTGIGAPRLAGSRGGLVLAGLYVTLPFVVRTVQPVVESLERDVEEAARVLGASSRQTFQRVILPQLAPAVAAGFGLAFARSMNEYGTSVLISGNVAYETLVAPVYVYQRVEASDFAGATGVAVTLLAICMAVLGATHLVLRWSARRGR
jgi:sulfate transport system permease protein